MLNMELDLQSLFGLLCTAVLIGWDPATPPLLPHLGSYTRALLAGKDRRHLFVTPCLHQMKGSFFSRKVLSLKNVNFSSHLPPSAITGTCLWIGRCKVSIPLSPRWRSGGGAAPASYRRGRRSGRRSGQGGMVRQSWQHHCTTQTEPAIIVPLASK